MENTKPTIRITTWQSYTRPNGTQTHTVKDYSAPSGTVDENWISLMAKYDEVQADIAPYNGVITHIFFKGPHQFDQPSDEVKQQVIDKIGRYDHFEDKQPA